MQRVRGSSLIIVLLIVAFLLTALGVNAARLQQSILSATNSNVTALQAYQYAESKADIVRVTKYNSLLAQTKTDIQNSNYQDEVLISEESNVNDHLERTVTVNVYLKGELMPRASVKLIRASLEASDIPDGSIIPWYGNLKEIPDGWHLCDGSSGTPDLRDRFIVGAGSVYNLGDIGGQESVKLEASEQPNHYHYFGYNYSSNNGQFPCIRDRALIPKYPASANGAGVTASKWNGSNGGNWWGWDGGGSSYLLSNLVTSLAYGTAADKAHENRPPYYALYYIMKKTFEIFN